VIVRYFAETDTLAIDLAARRGSGETRAISDDVTLELDAYGRVVALDIEHAAAYIDVERWRRAPGADPEPSGP
jgi:uncharacterized protein YuzE